MKKKLILLGLMLLGVSQLTYSANDPRIERLLRIARQKKAAEEKAAREAASRADVEEVTVEEVGEGVTSVKPGDRVAGVPLVPCMECEDCQKGCN